MFNLNKITVALLSAIAITACGGGGGSSGGASNNGTSGTVDNGSTENNNSSEVVEVQAANSLTVKVATVSNSVYGNGSAANSNLIASQNASDKLNEITVCLDTNGNLSCDDETLTAKADTSGKAVLSWDDTAIDTLAGKEIISVQGDGSTLRYGTDKYLEKNNYTEVNGTKVYPTLYLNTLSHTQYLTGGAQEFKTTIGDTQSADATDFSSTDPSSLSIEYQTLMNVLYEEGLTYSKVIKQNNVKTTIDGNYQKIVGYLGDNPTEGMQVTLVSNVAKAIREGKADPFANLGDGNVNPENHLPNADFAYKANGLTVAFTDQSTDPEGDVLEYSWDFGDGTKSTDASPSHTYAKSGVYQVVLIVSDGSLTNQYKQNVAVSTGSGDDPVAENNAPKAAFSYNANKLVVTFTNTSIDADEDILSYVWNFGDGKGANSTSDVQNDSFSYTFSKAGTYKVTLVANDGIDSNTVTQEVVVSGGECDGCGVVINNAPVASFDAVSNDLVVTFTNTSTDADGDAITSTWDFGNGNETINDKTFTKTFEKAGTYKVSLTVNDGKDNSKTVSKSITVSNGNHDDGLKCTLE